jgi:hypothetical protein
VDTTFAVSFKYSVLGLFLRSNIPIPELVPLDTPACGPLVSIHIHALPYMTVHARNEPEVLSYTSVYKNEAGEPALRVWKVSGGDLLHLAYYDGTHFWMNRQGTELWAEWPDNLTIEDAATYLLGPVLGLLLRLRGVICLHASAISFGDRAIAFVGSEGAGKSTTAAMLAQKGCAVISDDIVALVERQGSFYVYPAYPYLCLWSDSVTMVYGPDKKLPSFSASWDKRLLSLAGNNLKFAAEPVPLRAIFALGDRNSLEGAPRIEPLTAKEALLSLVANSYATNLLDNEMRAHEFEFLGRMLRSVPVQRLTPHEDPSQIGRLCDVVLRSCGATAI